MKATVSRKRRARNADYRNRFLASRWAEDLFLATLNARDDLVAIRYGLSKASDEVLVDVGDEEIKEPDIILFLRKDLTDGERAFLLAHGSQLDEIDRSQVPSWVFAKARCSFEVEFSPYRAAEMAGRHTVPKPLRPGQGIPKNIKAPVAPNVFVKEEDLGRLCAWRERSGVRRMFVAHFFDQEAFMVDLDELLAFREEYDSTDERGRVNLQRGKGIFYGVQTYNRIDAEGAAERKWVYRVHPSAATKIGTVSDVDVGATLYLSASKKWVSNVVFSGGSLELSGTFYDQVLS